MELDLTRTLHVVWALAPEIVLSLFGLMVLVKGARSSASRTGDAAMGLGSGGGWLAVVGFLAAAAVNGWLHGASEVGGGGVIAVDGLRLFSNWIFLAAGAGAVLISFGYTHRVRLQAPEFHGLVLFATVGMMLMAGARDLIVLFLGLEVMSIAVYSLTALNRRDRRSAEAGLKYFLLGAFSTGFFLYGIALVYGATGSVNLSTVADSVGSGEARMAFLLPGIALLVIGFGFKVSVMPFHMWTPDVYEGAPTPVTAWMSAAVKAAAFAAFLRVFLVAFGGSAETWQPVLWWLAAITMVVANLIALQQPNVKRMLAYSSIAHAGYLLVAIVAANEVAASGFLFYLLIYTAMNMGAFGVVICVAHHAEERLHVDDYAGFGKARPALAVLLTVFLLSLAGFPGTGGFMGKLFILQGAADAHLWSLAIMLVLSTLVSYWYYLRVAWAMWMRPAESEDSHDGVMTPLPMRVALAACVAVIVYTGVFPSSLLDLARDGAAVLFPYLGEARNIVP